MMRIQNKFIVSHAPFWHDGSGITQKSYHMMFAALPAVIVGIGIYGAPALAVMAFAVSTGILWELFFNVIAKRDISIGDGNAALLGMLTGMLLPATSPWWLVLTATFVTIVIGKQIFGGIGANPFHPVAVSIAILMVSWGDYFDFNNMLVNYDKAFPMAYPLASLKYFGVSAIDQYAIADLLTGHQAGGIGAVCGIGLILGGVYLILRGMIRWEIAVSFIVGVVATALIFNLVDDTRYANPIFHLLTGYTLIGAIFLAPEDASSPVNFFPMLLYGLCGGIMTVLIRNIGFYVDGVVFAILIINLIHPLLDKIRPRALGRGI